jgi:hypothetical protein
MTTCAGAPAECAPAGRGCAKVTRSPRGFGLELGWAEVGDLMRCRRAALAAERIIAAGNVLVSEVFSVKALDGRV